MERLYLIYDMDVNIGQHRGSSPDDAIRQWARELTGLNDSQIEQLVNGLHAETVN